MQVVFNGEIYNYRELRGWLEGRGHQFRTHSDTEVLVHLYEEAGDRLVERLRGMFAFALWDGRRRELLLARDRVGQKPLYYYRDGERLLFGSEVKAILAWPGVEREIDPAALDEYLAFGVIGGARSIFRRVRKLPLGHVLTIRQADLSGEPRRYWELPRTVDEGRSVEDWLEAIDAKLAETVQAHLVADVPVGAFLSGGLDSSAIVATAARCGAGPLKTFSIGFNEERFSELPYARLVARQFGTEHIEEVVTPEAVESLESLVHFYDEPFADSSAIPTMAVSRLAARHVKVVLSGDGGDEAFGGYARYLHDLREAGIRRRLPGWFRRLVLRRVADSWPKADWLPRRLRLKTALTNLALDADAAYANTLSVVRPALRTQLLHPEVRRGVNGFRPESAVRSAYGRVGADALRGMIAADVAFLLPDDFLTKVDRASMASGLEVRPPLVDHELLELAASMPSRFKVQGGQTKWLLKRLFADRLPRDVVHRPKQGFEIPIDDWLRGPLRGLFEDAVLAPGSRIGSYLDQATIGGLYQAHLRRVGRHGSALWAILVLAVWMDAYLSPHPSPVHPAVFA